MNGRRPHGGGDEPSAMPFKLKTTPRTMTTSNELPRLAVFIDAENVGNPESIELVFNKIKVEKLGTPTVKRVYGNPTLLHSKKWEAKCKEHDIEIVEQERFVPHKNSADVKIVVDAVRLRLRKNKNKINAFCFVSSDTDFRPLVEFISKGNRKVYGFGKESTSQALREVFADGFFSFEQLFEPIRKTICDEAAILLESCPSLSLSYSMMSKKLRENLGDKVIPSEFAPKSILKTDMRFNVERDLNAVCLRSKREMVCLVVRHILEERKDSAEWIPLTSIGTLVRSQLSLSKTFRLLATLKSEPSWFEIKTNEVGTVTFVRLLNQCVVTDADDA